MTLGFPGTAGPAGIPRLLVLIVTAALLAGCTGTRTGPTPSPAQSGPPRGGTLRIVVPSSTFTEEFTDPQPTSTERRRLFDPQLGRWFTAGLMRCCLVRTLYSYNGQPTEKGGSTLRPDLAAELPEVSADGLTWTIRIKGGLHYGPPLQGVEITAQDFVRGFHRMLAPSISAAEVDNFWYMLFLEIKGATEYNSGEAPSISGIETPDDHTLVFRLVQPPGDFGARLASFAAGPLPPDPQHPDAAFGIAEGADDGYGRFLVSSGPFMVEGSEQFDFSVPADRRAPAAGSKPGRLTLVRNPSWDRASDELRPAYADRIEIVSVDSPEQAVKAIDAGSADLVWPSGGELPTLPVDVYNAFRADPTRGSVYLNPTGWVRGAFLNLAVPPFDDLHVRRALNFAIDKQHLVDLQEGPVAAEAFGHLLADSYEDNLLADYDPYATPRDRGNLGAARAEMASSRYDTDGDGRCDAPACAHVRAVTLDDPRQNLAAAIRDDLEPLGIHLEVEVVDRQTFFYGIAHHPDSKIPLVIGMAYESNYVGGAGLLQMVFESRYITPETYNYTMVGATPDQLRKWGYEVTDVPNIDGRCEACVPLTGEAQFQCVADVDVYLMENVLAVVPLTRNRYAALASPRVLTYGFDELIGMTALDQIALKP